MTVTYSVKYFGLFIISKNLSVMPKSKNAKYKRSFDSFIRQILDVEFDDDDSLEEGVAVVSSDEGNVDECVDASDKEGSNERTLSIVPGEAYSISGGHIAPLETTQAGESLAMRPLTVFCTSEQLRALHLYEAQNTEPDMKGIIDPRTKSRKKNPIRKCANLDCL